MTEQLRNSTVRTAGFMSIGSTFAASIRSKTVRTGKLNRPLEKQPQNLPSPPALPSEAFQQLHRFSVVRRELYGATCGFDGVVALSQRRVRLSQFHLGA